MPNRGAYSASKYALEAWTDALRMELHASGVALSLIEPGPVVTAFAENVQQAATQRIENPKIADYFSVTPEAILKRVVHALESRRPKLRYPVSLVCTTVGIGKRFLPGKVLDWFLRRAAG
jgi:short-subunit dehydrogenase